MNIQIKQILDEMIESLEELNNEKLILQKRYREYYEKIINEKGSDFKDKDFYLSLLDSTEDFITLEDFEPNEIMTYLYQENLDRISELEKYALKLYKLYTQEDNEKIPYLETVKDKNLEKIKEAEQKNIINVNEFELLYGYSSSSQKGFRTRLNNPIPYIQKGFGSKILYNKDEVTKWLKGNKR